MKKQWMALFALLPIFSMASVQEVSKGYLYFGILPHKEKIQQVLKKSLTPQAYTQATDKINEILKNELGFDWMKDSFHLMGIDSEKYMEFFINPQSGQSEDFYFSIPLKKTDVFTDFLKKTLKKKWGGFSEKVLENQITAIETKNPKYAKNVIYYHIANQRIYFAPTAKILSEKGQWEKENDKEFWVKLESIVQLEKPFFVVYLGKSLLAQLSESSFYLNGAILGNYEKNEITISLLSSNDKDFKITSIIPGFLKDNPLLLVNIPIQKEELLKLASAQQDPQIQELLKILNLKDSLGNSLFLTVNEINYKELVQGMMHSTQLLLGFEIKDDRPYLALMDTMLGGNPEMNKAVRILYQEVPIYSIQDVDFGASKEIHIAVLKDYLLASFNQEALKKSIVDVIQKKNKVALPVKEKNLLMYFDAAQFFQKVPLSDYFIQEGIAANNIKSVVARYSEEHLGLIRLNVNLLFNR